MAVDLLSLPEEVLQIVAEHFTLTGWVKGPARACHLLYRLTLPRTHLVYYNRMMIREKDLPVDSRRISYALACADRHTGPSTTSISLFIYPVHHGLVNDLGQPRALTSPSTLACVGHLKLDLSKENRKASMVDNDDIGLFVQKMLEKLPNLIYASLHYSASSKLSMVPLLKLKHLELQLEFSTFGWLDGMPLGALLPSLETALFGGLGSVAVLNVLECWHLRRLILDEVLAYRIMKPPQCRLRVNMSCLSPEELGASKLQLALAEVNEVLLFAIDLYKPQGLAARLCLPGLEVVRCDWDVYGVESSSLSGSNDDGDKSCIANALVHCLSQCKNFPGLKSIICGNGGRDDIRGMRARIPARLAGVKELIIATSRPLQLVFDNASSAGERLDSFYAVGSEVRMDALALFLDALSKRGLTLSMAQAGEDDEDAPSQCMYICKLSAAQLSYDDAMRSVNANVQAWGRNHSSCGQCGACYKCLKGEGLLDSRW